MLVGIIDTGVDGSHPDIAPNFNAQLSRNFTVDIPVDANGAEIDGPCEAEPDQSCDDPSNVDEDGHGTHVASTIASPINGIGIAGVAPKATIVNLRAGQDSGYFFLQPSVDALTYAGDIGIDVVNMSYYVDPWLFNCTEQPGRLAGGPGRAAHDHRRRCSGRSTSPTGTASRSSRRPATAPPTTPRSSPTRRAPTSPTCPARRRTPRCIDPVDCISMPSEGNHVISVSSTGHLEAQGVLLRLRQRLRRRRGPRRRRATTRPTTPATSPRPSSPPTRRRWPRPTRRARPRRRPERAERRARTATPPAPARTTSTCRARRWRHRTRPAWRR